MRTNTARAWGLISVAAAASGCIAPSEDRAQPEGDSGAARQAVQLCKQTLSLSTGIEMAYLELGNPAGEPVIFLHGYTDTARSFFPTAAALAGLSADHRILVLDQRGHGDSSMPAAASCAGAPEQCFEPADMAGDVIAFMDAKGISEASVVGHSMGSFVAQELALSHPDRASRLVLIGTAASMAGNVVLQDYILAEPIEGSWRAGFEAQGHSYPGGVYNLTALDANADALTWMQVSWVVDPAADPDLIADVLPETAATKMGTWIGVAKALRNTDNTRRLQGLTVPTLILWATQDSVFHESDQQALLASLDVAAESCKTGYHFKQYGRRPLSELGIQTDDIGHNTQWGAPEEVARDVASYLREGKPTKDWYYSSASDPQHIVTEKGKAPIVHVKNGCD